MIQPPTKSQATKAGNILRAYISPDCDDPTAEAISDALTVVDEWRKAHAGPLQSATVGLRSRLATLGIEATPSQRLKRLITTINKLGREPRMNLGRMGDIGGCRAVVDTVDDIYRVHDRYRQQRPIRIKREKDYITDPRPSGYRALHFNVNYRGYLVEVQLRTRAMHEWAVMVENMSSRTNQDIKSGLGPPVVQQWFAKVSEAMALEEHGLTVHGTLAEEIDVLRARALPLLVRPEGGLP